MKHEFRFEVVYTRCEMWELPELDGEENFWEGDAMVEQKLFGILTARQLIWLLSDKDFDSTIHTQGIETKHGLIPAVNFYHVDTEEGIYVSVYTDEMMATIIRQKPKKVCPVLGGGTVEVPNCPEKWHEMTSALPEIISEDDINGYLDDEDLDRIAKEICEKLTSIMTASPKKKKPEKEK